MRGNYVIPPLRQELQTAYDEMNATGQDFAFAVCPTWDGKGWEVNTKECAMYCALPGSFNSKEEAQAAGQAWLEGIERAKPPVAKRNGI